MTLTAYRHRKRSIAFTMLVVWVFVFPSGAANACLAKFPGESVHAELAHEHERQPGKTSCLKACDEASQTVLRQPPKFDPGGPEAIATASRACGFVQLQTAATVTQWLVVATPPPSRSSRLQFFRLSL